LLERAPGGGVGVAGLVAGARVVGWLGPIALAIFQPPADEAAPGGQVGGQPGHIEREHCGARGGRTHDALGVFSRSMISEAWAFDSTGPVQPSARQYATCFSVASCRAK